MPQATSDPIELKRRRDILMSQVPKSRPLNIPDIFGQIRGVDKARENDKVIWKTHTTSRDEELRFKLSN